MINKILTYFPNSVTRDFPPADPSSVYHWFKETEKGSKWIGIPQESIPDTQLELLKVLFHYVRSDDQSNLDGKALAWRQFLFSKGSIPPSESSEARFIQFRILDADTDQKDLLEALKGFLPDHLIIFEQASYGVLVEEKRGLPSTLEELESIASTFESDFFTKIVFYTGKFQPISEGLPGFFEHEQKLFFEVMGIDNRTRVFTFEKTSPLLLATNLPDVLADILEKTIIPAFDEDRELMATIKVFLENNSNVSHAAKKLYIHRNTLQYRIDKFTERTGISLKDFDSAVMVYLACLYAGKR